VICKKDEMGRVHRSFGRNSKCIKVLDENPQEIIGSSRRRLEDNIKVDPK